MKKLKPVSPFIYASFVAMVFSSCCQTVDCSTGRLDVFTAVHFSRQDLSNLYIRQFEKNSNFTKVIDSMSLLIDTYYNLETVGTDSTKIEFNKLLLRFPIYAGYDYEFTFPNANTVRRITEITESRISEKFCNTGFSKNKCYNNIISLKVDGLSQALPVFRK